MPCTASVSQWVCIVLLNHQRLTKGKSFASGYTNRREMRNIKRVILIFILFSLQHPTCLPISVHALPLPWFVRDLCYESNSAVRPNSRKNKCLLFSVILLNSKICDTVTLSLYRTVPPF